MEILAKALGAAFVMAIGSIAPALGEGSAVCKALEGIARQPESSSGLRHHREYRYLFAAYRVAHSLRSLIADPIRNAFYVFEENVIYSSFASAC